MQSIAAPTAATKRATGVVYPKYLQRATRRSDGVGVVTARPKFDGAVLVITATLAGSNTASAENITVTSASPVCDLCRRLVAAGYGGELAMTVMRESTIALRIRAIGTAAKLSPRPDGIGFTVFRPGLAARAKQISAAAESRP
jgi:hypothetical protein